jgi:hypothetical protein
VEKTLEKPSKPLVFSKTVDTSYLAPEGAVVRRSRRRRGGQAGRPSGSPLLMPVDAVAELKVMGRSEQTIKWYRQKMEWYLDHEGGPATLDGLTSGEVKRLLGNSTVRRPC